VGAALVSRYYSPLTGWKDKGRYLVDSGPDSLHLVLLFPSFLATALARQSFLRALLFAGLQVVGVTLHFLDDVFLLHLALEAPQGVF
jgi:hypothetical protein